MQTVSAREHVFMLQNCASECVNNRRYRTLQQTCDEGAPCSSGQGSEALIGSIHIQALPTNRQKTRTCSCTCSCYKILCCNLPSDKNFLRKRACVRTRFKEHCAGRRHHGVCWPPSHVSCRPAVRANRAVRCRASTCVSASQRGCPSAFPPQLEGLRSASPL